MSSGTCARRWRAAIVSETELTDVQIEPEGAASATRAARCGLPDDHPLVRVGSPELHATAADRTAELGFHPAWPDTPILNEAGIPAVTYGPGSMDCYWDGGSVLVDDYLTAVRTYCLAAAGGPPVTPR